MGQIKKAPKCTKMQVTTSLCMNKTGQKGAINCRKPTYSEAVAIMNLAKTDQQRRENLAFWSEKYGEQYANRVKEAYQMGSK